MGDKLAPRAIMRRVEETYVIFPGRAEDRERPEQSPGAQRPGGAPFFYRPDSATRRKKISRRNAGLSPAIATTPSPPSLPSPLSTLPPRHRRCRSSLRLCPAPLPPRSTQPPAVLPPLPVLPANTMEPESISDNLTTLPPSLPFFFFVSRWNSVEE